MWMRALYTLLSAISFVGPALSERSPSLSVLAPRISEFKTKVHHILEGSRIRKKRELVDSNENLDYKLRFDAVSPENLPYLSDYNLTFWISVYHRERNQVLVGTTQGYLHLFEIFDADDKNAMPVAKSEAEDTAVKARAFSHDDEQWFAVLHSSSNGYYIRLYQRIGRGLERRQKIDLVGFSDMELITLKGTHYLVVASYNSIINQGLSYQASVRLYHWTRTQFDEIATRETYGARSVVCWVLDGSLYIAVGQEVDDEGNLSVGSPIYFYNSKEENRLVLWEMISTYGPRKVQHFHIAGNHYIVYIGKGDAVIYWWSSGQFLKWQTLSGTALASDLAILSLGDGEVAIVIALKEEALFYTLDASGYYILTLSMSLKGSSLRSLQFIFSGKAYYALTLFADLHPQSVWRLTLASHYLPSISTFDPIKQCLSDVQDLLKERETELDVIKSDLNRVWLKGSNQTIAPRVIVRGRIISERQSKVTDVVIIRYTKLPESSMSLVIATLLNLNDSAERVVNEMRGVVYISTRQEVRGTKRFNDPVSVPSLTMESSKDVRINDVQASKLKYALKKVGNQIFAKTTLLSNGYAENANIGILNGISTDDLLLLNGKQTVTGNLKFSHVLGNSFSVDSVNTIPVENIITTSSSSVIKDFKTFSLLSSDVIDVKGETNGVDLGKIGEKIVTTDEYGHFLGHLTFQHPINIHGNMFLTGKINKVVDISRLVSQSVTRTTDQDLTGRYEFKTNQVIEDHLLISGSINKVSVDNLLTLSSNQNIYADLNFTGLLTFNRDLLVGTVNDVDLSEEVLRKMPPYQFVTGPKIFTKNIQADFVDMTEYVTLDGVDPSSLVQDIVQHKQGVVKQNKTVFKDVVVLGDVAALGGINGHEVLDLSSLVWLKSAKQQIDVPVKAKVLNFKSGLDADRVNGLNLDTDVVHSYRDEIITSPKTFLHKVAVTKDLKMAAGVTLNGINPTSFKEELGRYQNEDSIHGIKVLESLEIFRNLKVQKLNNVTTSSFMRPDLPQTIQGSVEFAELATVEGDTQASSLFFTNLNGQNLQDFFSRAVTLKTASNPIRNKYFSSIKATHLFLPTASKIDGVSLHEMVNRVVTLNTPQLITSPKSFRSTMNFSELISVSSVNGLQLSDYVSNVVLTDKVSRISNKQFEGSVHSRDAFVSGTVNGINIQNLASDVFYKSEDNEITQLFIFKNDIDVGNLLTSLLDEVEWKDLIFLRNKEMLGPGWFLSNIHCKDIFVTGLLNGCDLSELASKSIYRNKTTQVINDKIEIKNIVIVGNLIMKKVVNQIKIEELQEFITTSEDEVITSDVVLDTNLTVGRLNLAQPENSKIRLIVKDAVRHSVPQVITGRKVFKSKLNATALDGGDIFVKKLVGIDLEELYRTAVRKSGYQEIQGDKTLSQLLMNVATVTGYLNGLHLPEDVVRSGTSEHISHPTVFMSDLFVTNVEIGGLLDKIDIHNFITNRVTLSGHQNVTAELIFNDDVVLYDALTVDGTVNEIVLELIARTKPVHPLQGYKVFIELYVSGSVSAATVNGYDVSRLSTDILRYNKEDYINEVQVFVKAIRAQNSLFAEWVNGVPLRHLTSTFASVMKSLTVTLEYLGSFLSTLQQQVNRQLLETQDYASKFAYFTLFQEINMGPTTKILYGYKLDHTSSEFSHSMVMWTTQKNCVFMEKCCHLDFSYWLRVKKTGVIMADEAVEPGRYYPIYDPSPITHHKDFFIWLNSTEAQPKWCDGQNRRIFLASHSHESFLDVSIDIKSAPLVSDAKSFRKGNLYTVVALYYDTAHGEYSGTVVYAYNELTQLWSEHQILPSFGVLSLDIIDYSQNYKDELLLASGTGMDAHPTYSTIYKWNNKELVFEVLQNVPSRYVPSILWIRKGTELLLSMASVQHWPNGGTDCSELISGGEINIYLYTGELKWIQSIPLSGVISMVSFSVDGDTFLAVASAEYQTVYFYMWKGFSKFVEIQSMFVGEVRHISIYSIQDDAYMTVALVSGPSKVLKMIRKGQSTQSNRRLNKTSLEQNGKTPKDSKRITSCV